MSVVEAIYRDPAFLALERRRSAFAWRLAAIVIAAYFAFILIIAFRPALFAVTVPGAETMTLGIPAGLAIIVLCFVLTGVYTRRANSEFDRELSELLARHSGRA